MKSKTFFVAFIISLSVHILVLSLSPIPHSLTSIEEGSTEISISMGESISIPKWKPPRQVGAVSTALGSEGHSGQNQSNTGTIRNSYLEEIRRRIEQFKRYPQIAKARNLEGSPKVEFIILESGDLKEVNIIESSKHQIFNNEAIATIRRAAPFPPIPQKLGNSAIKIALALVFKLKEN